MFIFGKFSNFAKIEQTKLPTSSYKLVYLGHMSLIVALVLNPKILDSFNFCLEFTKPENANL